MIDPAVLTAVGFPRRRGIFWLVLEKELTAGAIYRAVADVTFGAVSLQLRALLDAGLVETRAEKQNHFYRAKREALGELREMLERMWDDSLWQLKLQAELEETRRGPRAKRKSGGRAVGKTER